jgi:hypothetical protein
MNMKRILSALLASISLILWVFPTPVHAQFQDWGGCVERGVATLRCIPVVFHNTVSAALMFVGSVALILIIYGGFRMINSGGDAKQVGDARKILTYAVLGLVLVLASFGIINFIGTVTKSSNCITNIDAMAQGGCK